MKRILAVLQERRSVAQEGLKLQRLTGSDITSSHWDAFYNFYINTSGATTVSPMI
jgi:predicted N-acyltransferase